jgi:hypothetical protein
MHEFESFCTGGYTYQVYPIPFRRVLRMSPQVIEFLGLPASRLIGIIPAVFTGKMVGADIEAAFKNLKVSLEKMSESNFAFIDSLLEGVVRVDDAEENDAKGAQYSKNADDLGCWGIDSFSSMERLFEVLYNVIRLRFTDFGSGLPASLSLTTLMDLASRLAAPAASED